MVKKNTTNRKKATRKKPSAGIARAKMAAAAVLIGAMCALGLWQCFDGEDGSPLDPAEGVAPEREIDIGGGTPDPTLVNEGDLLKAEEGPANEPRFEPPPPGEEDDQQVTIGEAGEDVEEEAEEDEFPLHAVAYHFHTQVLAKPAGDARVVGYARRGSTFRVSKRVSTKGCPKGWHELKGGGFICDGGGVNVADEPVTFAPAPPKPRLNDPLPYDYKYAREDGVPEYWRAPTAEEIEETASVFRRLASGSKAQDTDHRKQTGTLEEAIARAGAIAEANETDAGVGSGPIEVARVEPEPEAPAVSRSDGGVKDPGALPPYVHLRMAKGYYVSTDDTVSVEDVSYQRTVRGRYVPADKLYPAKPSALEGVLLDDRNQLPMVFVAGGGVKKLTQEKEGAALKTGDQVTRYERFPFLGELKRKAKRYVRIGENEFLPARVAAVARQVEPPEDLAEGERWIDIDLSEQTLVAYEGITPVFATLISSGRKDFDTPEGQFRIYGKHVTITMDDPDGGEEAYSIEDVPWTQYFDEGYALHAAFWHDRFGRVRSHGCVNLSPADARRLFFWTGPHVSPGLHGMIATQENPGTRVVIHK